jgi:hypothetical protein
MIQCISKQHDIFGKLLKSKPAWNAIGGLTLKDPLNRRILKNLTVFKILSSV